MGRLVFLGFGLLSLLLLGCSSLQFTASSAQKYYKTTSELNFGWPVDRARLTQKYKNGNGKRHWGVDLASKRGTPIYAAEHGRVIYRGSGFRGYGKMIIIEHNKEWATLYSHFSAFHVEEGQWVNKGDLVGAMGATGNASGVHLHFELRHKRRPIDPLAYLPGATRRLASSGE